MTTVFTLQHVHLLPSGEEDVKLIGVYRSRAAAEAAAGRLAGLPGFSKRPQIVGPDSESAEGFHIDAFELDQDHWTEGFVTVAGRDVYEG